MTGDKLTLNIQKISSYILIGLSVVLFVFSLGFMTNFYQLFFDGNNEMYTLYKSLQSLNNVIFDSALILVVLSILQIPFDFHKNTVSIFGLLLIAITTFVNFSNALVFFKTNSYYMTAYKALDYTELEGYKYSLFPFNFGSVMFGLTIVMTVTVLIISIINYVKKIRK